MCVVKTPRIPTTTQQDTQKPLQVLRNPLLDGIDGSINSLRVGRNSLRIDRSGSGIQTPLSIAPQAPQIGAVS